jgi:hypothetical protein
MSQVAEAITEQSELRVLAPNATMPAERRRGPSGSSGPRRGRAPGQSPAIQEDVWIYRIVVAALGLVLLITAIGGVMVALGAARPQSMELLIALASGSVGALAGLLSPTGAR